METIKHTLLCREVTSQIHAIEKINNGLQNLHGKELQDYIEKLICTGIGQIICDNLTIYNAEYFLKVMNYFDNISKCKKFFTSSLAVTATAKIFQLGFFIAHNPSTNHSLLKYMAGFLANCSDRARFFHISFNTKSDIDKFLSLIKTLDISNTKHPIEIISGSHLLCVMMKYINDHQITVAVLQNVKKSYEDCLRGLIKIIPENVGEDLLPISKSISIALNICIEGLRLNVNSEENHNSDSGSSQTSDPEKFKLLQEITQFTFGIVVDVIIPNFRKTNESQEKFALIKSFVECLILLFTSKTAVDLIKLAYELLIQKYLIYFLEMIQNSDEAPENTEFICQCVSNIIMIQAELCLSIDKWSDGSTSFQIFINDGLSLFATNPTTRYDSSCTDTLLFCYYFHYLYNLDYNIIDALREIPLAEKIANFSVDDPPQVPIIQVTWFFFSILLVETDIIKSNKYVADALDSIISLLNELGVETCYVHHPAVLTSVLRISIFPNEIRNKVVKLSLGAESPLTNIYELVGAEYKNIIVASLMNTLLSGKGIAVERASEELNKIILEYNSTGLFITTLLWTELPQLLSCYKQECEENVEQYLKLLCESAFDVPTNDIAMKCSSKLLETFKCNDIEIKEDMKCYIIILIFKMVSLISEENIQVISLFIEDESFIQDVYKETNKERNDELSIASFICLTSIIKNQIKFSIKGRDILLVNASDLSNALKRKSSVCYAALKFSNLIWISGIMTSSPSINIRISTDEINVILRDIYQEILKHFGKTAPIEWEFMFSVLTNFLNFCRKNYPGELRSCCDYPWTLRRINSTIKYKYSQKEFFEFAKTWLQSAISCNSGYAEEAFYSKQVHNIGQTHIFWTASSFEVTVKNLNQYIHSLIDAERVKKENMEELIQTISRII